MGDPCGLGDVSVVSGCSAVLGIRVVVSQLIGKKLIVYNILTSINIKLLAFKKIKTIAKITMVFMLFIRHERDAHVSWGLVIINKIHAKGFARQRGDFGHIFLGIAPLFS